MVICFTPVADQEDFTKSWVPVRFTVISEVDLCGPLGHVSQRQIRMAPRSRSAAVNPHSSAISDWHCLLSGRGFLVEEKGRPDNIEHKIWRGPTKRV